MIPEVLWALGSTVLLVLAFRYHSKAQSAAGEAADAYREARVTLREAKDARGEAYRVLAVAAILNPGIVEEALANSPWGSGNDDDDEGSPPIGDGKEGT